MKGFIVKSDKHVDRWLKACGAVGQAWFGFLILIRSDVLRSWNYDICLNHEKIHLQQQRECAVLFFYLIYLGHFIGIYVRDLFRKLPKKKEQFSQLFWESYRKIVFEKEAYRQEANKTYLNNRKLFAFWR